VPYWKQTTPLFVLPNDTVCPFFNKNPPLSFPYRYVRSNTKLPHSVTVTRNGAKETTRDLKKDEQQVIPVVADGNVINNFHIGDSNRFTGHSYEDGHNRSDVGVTSTVESADFKFS
jgi:hypothetical protein